MGTGEFRYRPGQEGTRCKPCNLHGSARGRGTSCDALSPAHARPQARTTAEQLGWKGSSWAPIRDASGGRVLRHALAQSCASRRLVPTPPNSPSASARLARAGPSLSTRLGASIPVTGLSASGRVPVARTCPRGRSAAAAARPQPPPHAKLAADLPLTAVGAKLSVSAPSVPCHFGQAVGVSSGICSSGAMEPALGSERRSPPGPGAPRPPPRGHAPSTTAPAPSQAPVSSSVQPDEERQPRISESGQFSDGLEDRGELPPPRALSPPPLRSHLSPVSAAQRGEQRRQSHLSGFVPAGGGASWEPLSGSRSWRVHRPALSGVRGKSL